MPTISTPTKIAATKGYGAHVSFSGSTSSEREAAVKEVIANTNAVLIPPYDHPDIILGQGTMALELEQQVAELVAKSPGLSAHHSDDDDDDDAVAAATGHGQAECAYRGIDAIIAPLGGGGMLAGLATAMHPTPTRIFGAEPSFQGADDALRGLRAGHRIPTVSSLTIADGLRTPVGETNWDIISNTDYVR
ncbi:MAG: hypothetical protein Q9164_006557, partial [Protoblastenia rupestris]